MKTSNMARPAASPLGGKPSPVALDKASSEDRLYEVLARKLFEQIISGRYAAGDRLPAERELAIEYEVSRPTVREAMIALEVQGLIEVRVGSGAYVKPMVHVPDPPGFNVSAFELTEARLLIEGETAALAAIHVTDAQLDELADLVIQIADENMQPDGAEHADRAFHLLIARATRNGALVDAVENLWRMRSASPESALLLAKARTAQIKPVVEEHRVIVEALCARDPARARAAMRAHLGAVLDHLLFATEAQAVEEVRRAAVSTRERFSLARGM